MTVALLVLLAFLAVGAVAAAVTAGLQFVRHEVALYREVTRPR